MIQIENIKLNKDNLVYKIWGKEYIFNMDVDIIKFFENYRVSLYDLVITEKGMKWDNTFNELFKEVRKMTGNWYQEVRIYEYENYILNEREIRQRIKQVYNMQYQHLEFYIIDLAIPKTWYLKERFNIYGNFHGDNIHKYDSPAVIENLKTWKRRIEQPEYYDNFNLSYYQLPNNKISRGTMNNLFNDIEDLYINN